MKRKEKKKYDGNTETMISTGSTLLDLAITGGRVRGGGLPGGILVEDAVKLFYFVKLPEAFSGRKVKFFSAIQKRA